MDGLDRRRFLGAAAAGAALTVLPGCDAHSPTTRLSAPPPTPAPTPTPTPAPEQVEQARPGNADWRIRDGGPQEAIQGYADQVSVLPGQSFALHVSTTAPGFTVSAYRIGWYGGAQARLVWRSARIPGRVQQAAGTTADTRTVRAAWKPTVTVATGADWPAGAYLLRLDAENGHQRYVPMVLRSANAAGRTLLMHGVATWQAYNLWGGSSLYQGDNGAYASRSLAVSFDRPYDGSGADLFLVYERALVVLAERLGIPLAYTTGYDVHRQPELLTGAATLVSLGHDEYWTPEQRAAVTRARDAGSNVAFLGANTCFRRIRFEDGGRTVVCYKTAYRDDPVYGGDPAAVTTDFRAGPGADPESSLTGVLYEGYPTDAPYVVRAADHWLYAGTGVSTGDSFPHLVGVEYDRVTPGDPTPRPIEVLAHSPLVCNGNASHSDTAYYTVPSGAGVFASGTMRWVEGLMAGTHDDWGDHGMDARTGAFVTRATQNLLTAFAQGPAAHHLAPPRDNLATIYN
ncbi:N,N-dimethylformamidase beta subunit family domain-containing protein [Streptacidiphilus sp. EB129]|uniref:N,N-dimethylformamidase beta subunit family domain-containing protein n=1 Tax=Streptacidiphilus sp. EB129 TaxID=3156262 RepID=UPI003512EC53